MRDLPFVCLLISIMAITISNLTTTLIVYRVLRTFEEVNRNKNSKQSKNKSEEVSQNDL